MSEDVETLAVDVCSGAGSVYRCPQYVCMYACVCVCVCVFVCVYMCVCVSQESLPAERGALTGSLHALLELTNKHMGGKEAYARRCVSVCVCVC